MKRRWVQIDGELVEVPPSYRQARENAGPYIQPDIQPYKSMATGEMITSRSHHRAHLRQHGLIEIGNEIEAAKRKGPPRLDGKRKQHIAETMKQKGLL